MVAGEGGNVVSTTPCHFPRPWTLSQRFPITPPVMHEISNDAKQDGGERETRNFFPFFPAHSPLLKALRSDRGWTLTRPRSVEIRVISLHFKKGRKVEALDPFNETSGHPKLRFREAERFFFASYTLCIKCVHIAHGMLN